MIAVSMLTWLLGSATWYTMMVLFYFGVPIAFLTGVFTALVLFCALLY